MKKILISRNDAIGDVVLTLPLAGFIKKLYPSISIFFLGRTYTEAVINRCEYIDEFLNFDSLFKNKKKKQILKNYHFDIIIHAKPDIAIAKLAFLAKIPLRIGVSRRWFHWIFCNQLPSFSRKKSNLHESQLNLFLLQKLVPKLKIPDTKEIYTYFGLKKIRQTETKNQKTIIIHPGSRGSSIDWNNQHFISLVDLISKESEYKILLTGSSIEKKSISLELQNHKNINNLIGKLSLSELINTIEESDALIANSTGPLHIAAALGIISIGIFCPLPPIFPTRWKPLGKKSIAITAKKTCTDCKKISDCSCVNQINHNEVWKQLKNFIKY